MGKQRFGSEQGDKIGGSGARWGAESRAHLMEQVRLQQGGFVTQGRVRGLRRQQQVLQERGQQLSRQRSKGGPRPSAVPARRRPGRPVLGGRGGARGDTLHKQCGTRSPGHQARSERKQSACAFECALACMRVHASPRVDCMRSRLALPLRIRRRSVPELRKEVSG